MAEESIKGSPRNQVVRGLVLPALKLFTRKNIEDAMDYVPKDGDLVIASYPKTGTTWMQYIVIQIQSNGEYFPKFEEMTYKVVPNAEVSGIAAIEALQKPRCYKHHLPFNYVQKNDKSKCIYIYRHPEDTVVSFYHFLSEMADDHHYYDFDEFVDNFVTHNMGYGNYFKHVMSFYEHRADDNLLFVSYEKLQANKKEEILRIAKFLNEKYYQRLSEDEETLSKVMKHTSFEYMKANLYLTNPQHYEKGSANEPGENLKINFFRKGIVGDGKNALSETQQQRIREAAMKLMSGTTIVKEWYPD